MIRVEDVLSRISTKEGLEYYGVRFNAKGFAHCPFHDERTPSFHYNARTDRYHCFSCGKGGNIIDFVSAYFHYDLPKELPAVLKKIDQDFQLGVEKQLSDQERNEFAAQQRDNKMLELAEKAWKNELSISYNSWCSIFRELSRFSADDEDLRVLLVRLEDALEDFSGNLLRGWPPEDLNPSQMNWLEKAMEKAVQREEDYIPTFGEFCDRVRETVCKEFNYEKEKQREE